MRRRASAIEVTGLTLGLIAAGASCSGGDQTPKACTLIGCADNFTASAQRADGSIPDGAHRIEVLVDGTTLKCAFTLPLATLQSGGTAQPTCDAGLTVTVVPAMVCIQTEGPSGTSSQTCNTIPGKFVETLTLSGAPGQVHVWQYVDDAPILDVAVAPQYADSRPNGPGCPPVCRQALVAWTMN
jgi:hypothetical protein